MGGKKKKSNNGPIKKESKYKIPARFDCPLCDAKSSIAVKIFRKTGEAVLHCRKCKVGEKEHFMVRPLEKAVDVFFRFRESLLQIDRERAEKERGSSRFDQSTTPAHLADGRTVQLGKNLADLDARQRPPQSYIDLGPQEDDDDDGTHYFQPREEIMEDDQDENPEFDAMFA